MKRFSAVLCTTFAALLVVGASSAFAGVTRVVANTVNTMPEKTLDAVADHGEIRGDRVRPFYDDVIAVLIKEGVDKFVTAWSELGETVTQALEAAKSRS